MRSYGMKPPEMDARATRAYLGNITQEAKYLTAAISAGATSASVPFVPRGMGANLGWIVIDAYTSQCEVRKITSKTLESVSWSGNLDYAHSSGDVVLFLSNPVLNLEYFGGAGDNSTDNSDAFTKLAAQLDTIGGGAVMVGPGTYLFGDTISWPTGVVGIYGHGASTIFKYTATDGTNAFEFVDWDRADGTWTVLRDFTLEGAGKAATGTGAGLYFNNAIGATIEGLVIRRFGGGPGIYLHSMQQAGIRDCWIVDNDMGVHLADDPSAGGHSFNLLCVSNTIDNCHIQGNASHGVYLEDTSGSGGTFPVQTHIRGTVIQGNGGAGIYAEKFQVLTIEGVYFEENQQSTTSADIYLGQGFRFTIKNTEHHAASPSGYKWLDCDARVGDISQITKSTGMTGTLGSNTRQIRFRVGGADEYLFSATPSGTYHTIDNDRIDYTATDGDTTPSVREKQFININNSTSTTITMFDDGIAWQEVFVRFLNANTTIDFTGTNLKGNGNVDWNPGLYDCMRMVFDGTRWLCDVIDV